MSTNRGDLVVYQLDYEKRKEAPPVLFQRNINAADGCVVDLCPFLPSENGM